MEDPIIHFYEDFLSSYDPKLRKARGVWYTPHPVVNFIIRAVDDILIDEFGLPMGLADTSKTTIKVPIPTHDKRFSGGMREVDQEVHRVQFLDPATGTGTFVAEAINQIYSKFKGQQGLWNSYVENHLLPRINGFELLMASYAMAHLKLDLLLKQTGYTGTKGQRFRIYLTNSLEEYHKDTGTLFANWLSAEANEANQIKRDAPVMIVAGNPPYSVSSTNKGAWIENLVADYKKNLNERNIQPLSDDYIKFIRYGQHFIEKNGSGILAFITNNSFLDGIIHRQMRKNLLETFDKIYILDLHGNAKKKETAPDGSKDENVFDIQAGVSINIFIKNKNQSKTKLNHIDLFGSRKLKYEFLVESKINSIQWKKLDFAEPNYYFADKNFEGFEDYEKGFKTNDLFKENSNGIKTQRDDASICFSKKECNILFNDFRTLSEGELRNKYKYIDVRDWKISYAIEDFKNNKIISDRLMYRPFDFRYMNYTGKTKGVMGYPRFNIMRNFLDTNIGLIVKRGFDEENSAPTFLTKLISDTRGWSRPGMQGAESIFPLYLYPDSDSQLSIDAKVTRTPNLDMKIVAEIAKGLGLKFVPEKDLTPDPSPEGDGSFAPIDLLDYIYAVLHSPTYRETYKEFLKIDFPRVPYPEDAEKFWKLVQLGGELRALHLMESPSLNDYITEYPVGGDNEVEKPRFEATAESDLPGFENLEGLGKVYINSEQYFDRVPELAWNFYIGGYQPAQKWLKDRKGRVLDFEDILHYQKIIKALAETDRVMGEIDGVEII
jgi:predicted helicase